MSTQEVTAVISRFQAATDALAVGRGSMMMPTLLRGSGEFNGVSSFPDIGTGVGLHSLPRT